MITLVQQAIKEAAAGHTKLPSEVLSIRGHGDAKMSIFLNTICGLIPNCQYLEFGTFTGRSLAAAAYGNTGTYTGVDKLEWLGSSIKFNTVQDLRRTLFENLALVKTPGVLQVDRMDFHDWTPTQPRVDVFFYDADHGLQGTRDGVVIAAPLLRPGVLVMDDYLRHKKSKEVQEGTLAGLKDSKLTVLREWTLPWHTGVWIGVVDNPTATEAPC